MEKTYFDRIVLREAYEAEDILEALAILEKYDYEIVHQSTDDHCYYIVFEYKGKRKANIRYIELVLDYNEKLKGYIESGNQEEYLDWISFATEGIWTAFSDVVKLTGVLYKFKDESEPISMRNLKNLMEL